MEKVKKGDTIRIIRMNDDGGKDLQARMYNGRSGFVEYIDSLGQLHGTWGGLAINPEIDDFKLYALNDIIGKISAPNFFNSFILGIVLLKVQKEPVKTNPIFLSFTSKFYISSFHSTFIYYTNLIFKLTYIFYI